VLTQMRLGARPAQGVVTSGRVAEWDALESLSYPGSGSTWSDISGFGNHLTLQNSPAWSVGGWFSTGALGYFRRATGIALPQGNDAYTMQAWVRRASWGSAQGVMSIGGSGVVNGSNGIFTLNSMVGHFRHYWWGNDLNATNNNAALALNVWFLVTARFDGTTRSLLANTTPVASDTPAGHNVTSLLIEVARTSVGLSDYWSADIAVARIYNRALSNAEVAQNFDAQKARFGL
jgi:hypothetical protein